MTILRPGQIVGIGGFGFDAMVRQAKRPICVNLFGNGRQKMCNIAIDDLTYYLIGVFDDPRAYGRCYDIGCDDVLTNDRMIDVAADVLGLRHPVKIGLPPAILGTFAPIAERAAKLPRGALKGLLDSVAADCVGDVMPLREILPRPPLSYREAVVRALMSPNDTEVRS